MLMILFIEQIIKLKTPTLDLPQINSLIALENAFIDINVALRATVHGSAEPNCSGKGEHIL